MTKSAENSARPASHDGRNRGAFAAATGCSVELRISVIAHEQPSIAEGEGHADDEQDHADGGAEADAHAGDAEVIEERNHRVRRLEGAAAGQRYDDIKKLQRADD